MFSILCELTVTEVPNATVFLADTHKSSAFCNTWWAWVCGDVLSTGGFRRLATKPCMLSRKYSSPPQKLLLPVLHSSSALWVSLRWELGTGGRVSKLPTELRSMREEGGRDKREFGGTQQGIDIKSEPFKGADWLVLEPLSHKQENVRQGGVTDGVVHPDAELRLRPEIKSLAASGGESAPLSLRPSSESLYCRRWLNHAAIITLISWFPWDL